MRSKIVPRSIWPRSASVANLANISLARDNVFSDGADLETPVFTGDASKGFNATLSVAVKG